MVDIPIVQSIGIDVCILFCILSISIVLYCGLLAGELAQLCYIVYGWYPYCPIHWNWCLYLVLHTFHIHCPLLWITSGELAQLCYIVYGWYPYCPIHWNWCLYLVLHTFHIHCPLLWITSQVSWLSYAIMCMVDIPIVQSIGIDVCILFCILSISIVLYCGLLACELAQLCYIVYGWYPYCPIHWNWCLYLVLHTFHIHCPLLWITSRVSWLSYAILCMVDIPIVQSIGIDVCILFCILSISIVLYCGLLVGELAQLCYIVYCWYPYCPIHWNWCLYLVLHTFHIHCPLLWITSDGELAQLCYIVCGWYPYCPIHWNWCLYLVLHTFHIHCPLLWITRWWVGSVMLYCVCWYPIVQSLELMFVSCFAYFPYPLSFTVDY